MTDVLLRTSAWFGDNVINIHFPVDWDVRTHFPQKLKPISQGELSNKINRFLQYVHLDNVLNGAKLGIIVDDLSRPTPVSNTLSVLLTCLRRSGVNRNNIVIITAGGTHDKMNSNELRLKLGDEIATKYHVVAHNPYKHLCYCGHTQRGTPVYLNKLVGICEFMIAIGGVYPHSPSGFGGGAKMILGVCGFRTIAYLHYNFTGTYLGGKLNNTFRLELEEISEIARLLYSISIIINDERCVAKIYSGDLVSSHKDAVTFYKKIYCVPAPTGADIVVANTYPFDTTLLFSKKGWWPTKLSRPGSMNIIIGALPLGVGNHGIHPISKNYISHLRRTAFLATKLPFHKVLQLILRHFANAILRMGRTNLPSKHFFYFQSNQRATIDVNMNMPFYYSWKDILNLLVNEYTGTTVKVEIYSCAALQYPLNDVRIK